ncbi:MAG TPA: tetratricopeptide repeat-containing glycosyltransferase family protein [Pirellulaceae bacterium]|jgi:tetratricopeptide (TPR) repeat protein
MATVNELLAVAIRQHQEGRLGEAEQLCKQILAVEPTSYLGWHLLGRICHDGERYVEAVQHLSHSLSFSPQNPLAYLDLGRGFLRLDKGAEAATCFRKALELKPDYPEAHVNLGLVFERAEMIDDAIACYRRALELSPNFPEASYNLANMCQLQGRLDDAIGLYQKAIYNRPNFAKAYNGLGAALQVTGDLTEAANCYARALAIHPSLADAHVNRAQLLLLRGDFEHGWQEYEWRWMTGQIPSRSFRQPRWDGDSLAGKTILLYAEQGLGDTLHFIRYAPLVKARGGGVIVECPKVLVKLLTRCRGIDRLVGYGEELPDFDVQSPLLSLPGILGTSLDTIPSEVPYVDAEAMLVAKWRERLNAIGEFQIGINWFGSPGHDPSQQRDIPLEQFTNLAQNSAVRLVSLQKDKRAKHEIDACPHLAIIDFGDELDGAHGAFMDSAAIMANLDLVITSDTSIAHLAGALGVAVWVVLPHVPEWRWLLDRSDSPWYPTMRLFRQKKAGDWKGVFEELEAAIQQQLALQ